MGSRGSARQQGHARLDPLRQAKDEGDIAQEGVGLLARAGRKASAGREAAELGAESADGSHDRAPCRSGFGRRDGKEREQEPCRMTSWMVVSPQALVGP